MAERRRWRPGILRRRDRLRNKISEMLDRHPLKLLSQTHPNHRSEGLDWSTNRYDQGRRTFATGLLRWDPPPKSGDRSPGWRRQSRAGRPFSNGTRRADPSRREKAEAAASAHKRSSSSLASCKRSGVIMYTDCQTDSKSIEALLQALLDQTFPQIVTGAPDRGTAA